MIQQPSLKLPAPTPEALAHSRLLIEHIKQQIAKNHGQITFEQFMNLALYAPGLGYYDAGCRKIGAEGDFVTAPEISSLFSYAIARQCQAILSQLDTKHILEFGAGSGKMAVDILIYLAKNNALPEQYLILEPSAELKQRQQETFEQLAPHLLSRVQWLTCLPTAFEGIMLANEVLDAMPVHRFRIQDGKIYEYYVAWRDNAFTWVVDQPSTPQVAEEISSIKNKMDPVHKARHVGRRKGADLSQVKLVSAKAEENHSLKDEGYTSEINLRAKAWINSLSHIFTKGCILCIDYGFPSEIYYHPERREGTLMCHYRHHAHTDPLILVGLQDITAHVDFSYIAEAAITAGLMMSGYVTQSKFLLDAGLLDFVDSANDLPTRLRISRQIQTLTLPHEMGELFKVMLLSKNIEVAFLHEKNSCHHRKL